MKCRRCGADLEAGDGSAELRDPPGSELPPHSPNAQPGMTRPQGRAPPPHVVAAPPLGWTRIAPAREADARDRAALAAASRCPRRGPPDQNRAGRDHPRATPRPGTGTRG